MKIGHYSDYQEGNNERMNPLQNDQSNSRVYIHFCITFIMTISGCSRRFLASLTNDNI
jgi:hypothetical protein